MLSDSSKARRSRVLALVKKFEDPVSSSGRVYRGAFFLWHKYMAYSGKDIRYPIYIQALLISITLFVCFFNIDNKVDINLLCLLDVPP